MELAKQDLGIGENAGLLYPRKDATPIEGLEPNEIPQQFVFLDGTWNHARTMYRDIPFLKTLPCYRLTPASPSRYLIRKEPTLDSLSTLEAVVSVLQQFEPELGGLDRLMAAFDLMNQQQVDELKPQECEAKRTVVSKVAWLREPCLAEPRRVSLGVLLDCRLFAQFSMRWALGGNGALTQRDYGSRSHATPQSRKPCYTQALRAGSIDGRV